jgi:D-alanine transaminase
MNTPLVWMDGEFISYDSARVSIEDRGFQFSDGIYEVFRAIKGRYFCFDEHMARLRRSLESVEITLLLTDLESKHIADEMLARLNENDATLYIQVTRGVAARTHLFPENMEPTVIIIVRPYKRPKEESYSDGIGVITLKDERWLRCDIKSIALLANALARNKARQAKVEDAIFIRDGYLTEATATNVFVLTGGELATPLADHRILRGVTRDYVLSLARGRNVPTAERDIPLSEVKDATEIFLTSTTMDVLPVVRLNHRPVGSGTVGPVTRMLLEDYRKALYGE